MQLCVSTVLCYASGAGGTTQFAKSWKPWVKVRWLSFSPAISAIQNGQLWSELRAVKLVKTKVTSTL